MSDNIQKYQYILWCLAYIYWVFGNFFNMFKLLNINNIKWTQLLCNILHRTIRHEHDDKENKRFEKVFCICIWNTFNVFVFVFEIHQWKMYLYLYLYFQTTDVFVFVFEILSKVFDPMSDQRWVFILQYMPIGYLLAGQLLDPSQYELLPSCGPTAAIDTTSVHVILYIVQWEIPHYISLHHVYAGWSLTLRNPSAKRHHTIEYW